MVVLIGHGVGFAQVSSLAARSERSTFSTRSVTSGQKGESVSKLEEGSWVCGRLSSVLNSKWRGQSPGGSTVAPGMPFRRAQSRSRVGWFSGPQGERTVLNLRRWVWGLARE